MLLKGATIYDEDFNLIKSDILIKDEKIHDIAKNIENNGESFDLSGYTIMPGFIDMHIHGCAGYDTTDATPQAIKTISNKLVEYGVTSFCPTSMTLSFDALKETFENIEQNHKNLEGAYIHGVNMEGPYIAKAKKGAQNADYVRNPDIDEFKKLYDIANGLISVVDIAPECQGSESFVKEIQPIVPVSIAHTDANYNQTIEAINWGVRHVTHLFNAMSGFTHREPGVVGAVFDSVIGDKNIGAELICDGFHIHPAALRVAFDVLGEDNSIIVSDSMRGAGGPDGEYDLGGQTVYVKDGKARLADGTIAASTTNVYDEFKNVLRFGVSEKQAVKSATINPARAIRKDDSTGSIAKNKYADLLVMDNNKEIVMVIVKGKIKVNNL